MRLLSDTLKTLAWVLWLSRCAVALPSDQQVVQLYQQWSSSLAQANNFNPLAGFLSRSSCQRIIQLPPPAQSEFFRSIRNNSVIDNSPAWSVQSRMIEGGSLVYVLVNRETNARAGAAGDRRRRAAQGGPESPVGICLASANAPGNGAQSRTLANSYPYRKLIFLLVLFSMGGNGANLFLPRLLGMGIDEYNTRHQVPLDLANEFAGVCLLIWLFSSLQSLVQVYTAEKVARDLRSRLALKISQQDFQFVQRTEPSRLLTNLTSDVDSVKTFVAEVIAGLLSSVMILIGATLMLLSMNWRLALGVLAVIPGIAVVFIMVLRKVRPFFKQTREVLDTLNKVINESVLGAALIRVVDGGEAEARNFEGINSRARGIGLTILSKFAVMIPVVNIMAQTASVIILAQGGYYVVSGRMSLGDLATFNGYLAIVIFPIFVIGFMNSLIAQAQAAYTRLQDVLEADPPASGANLRNDLTGSLEVRDLCISYAQKPALQNVSLRLRPGTRTAILGPTAAGKTQLLYLLTGLLKADSGEILFDGRPLSDYESQSFHRQVAIVFQESILFNMSVRDNVAFAQSVDETAWRRALDTAELSVFLKQLPEGENTIVSERGSSLSGGQKQRLMLARALAMNPKLLLLDDFTARVDGPTERKILQNLSTNYPGLTLLAVTQRISTIQDYDHIILLMQGEVLAQGTHQELLQNSPEYVQIFESQRSTQEYELPTE